MVSKAETLARHELVGHPSVGRSFKVIARKLSLSEKTIERYRSRVMGKLNARSVAELVRIALSAIG